MRLREVLEEEQKKTRRMGAGHKQKLTHKQIHEILAEEGYDISLVTINIELARIRQKQKRCSFVNLTRMETGWSTTSVRSCWTVGRA